MKKSLLPSWFPTLRMPSVPQLIAGFVAIAGVLSALSVGGPLGVVILVAFIALVSFLVFLGVRRLVHDRRSALVGDGATVPRLVPVKRLDPARPRRVFVYGSLLSPQSVVKAVNLARRGSSKIHALDCIPAKLGGYRQDWIEIGRVTLRDREAANVDKDCWLALSVQESAAASDHDPAHVLGAVIAVTETEFQAIRDRERHYRAVDVHKDLVPISDSAEVEGEVIAFIGDETRADVAAPERYSIRQRYLDQINAGLRELRLPQVRAPSVHRGKPVDVVDALFAYELFASGLRTPRGKAAQRRTQKRIREILIQDAPGKKQRSFGIAPLVLEKGPYQSLVDTAQHALSGAVKVTAALAGHDELLDHVQYSKEDIDALRRAAELDGLMPLIARADLVLTKRGARLLELNCDSPAGMRQIDVLSAQQTHLVHELGLDWIDARRTSAVDAVVQALIDSRPNTSSCALIECDIPGWQSVPEMRQFVERLQAEGLDSELIDIAVDTATFDGRELKCRGRTWDKVYKRVVWSDLKKLPAARESRDALVAASVAHPDLVSNSMGARVAGSKFVLAGLSDPAVRDAAGLDENEQRVARENVLWSALWGEDAPKLLPGGVTGEGAWKKIHDQVYADPTAYVWKPVHGLAGRDIVFGYEERAYHRALSMSGANVVQKYTPHGRVLADVISLDERQTDWKYALYGVYLVNGQPIAVEAKLHNRLPVNMAQGAARTAVFPCK